jgi:hypothetical protein
LRPWRTHDPQAQRSTGPVPRKGFPAREFFPHTAAIIRKRYLDTLLLLEGCGMTPPELLACGFCQLNLYSECTSGLPDELFTDSTVNWHHQ